MLCILNGIWAKEVKDFQTARQFLSYVETFDCGAKKEKVIVEGEVFHDYKEAYESIKPTTSAPKPKTSNSTNKSNDQ